MSRRVSRISWSRLARLERLKGDQAGRYSLRINDQYCVTFRWEQGHAYEVRVEGYH
jgi:proteic killer suppression protein